MYIVCSKLLLTTMTMKLEFEIVQRGELSQRFNVDSLVYIVHLVSKPCIVFILF